MELQIKITSHLLGWLLSKRQQIRSVGLNVKKLEALCSFDGSVQSLWKTVWSVLKKKKILSAIWSCSTPSGFVSKRIEIELSKRCLFSHVHCSIIYNSQDIEQMVKTLPAMQETWVQSLGWEDPLEKENLETVKNICLSNVMCPFL